MGQPWGLALKIFSMTSSVAYDGPRVWRSRGGRRTDGEGVGREAALGEDLFAADDGVADDNVAGLEEDGEHGAHVEASGLRHGEHHGCLGLGVAEKDGGGVGDDLADDALLGEV